MTKNLNAFQNFQGGFSIMDSIQQRNLEKEKIGLLQQEIDFKRQQAQQKLQQEEAKQSLALEAFNNPEAFKMLASKDSKMAQDIAGMRNNINRSISPLIDDVLNAKPIHKQEVWNLTKNSLSRMGVDISDLSSKYSPQVETLLRQKQKESRTWDDTFRSIETDRGLMMQSEKTGELRPTGYDTLQNRERRVDIAKKGEDLLATKQEREKATQAGLSPSAYKKQQELFAAEGARKQIALPKAEDQAQESIDLIDSIVTHPGMKSMVGAKNIFSGAASTFIPFTDKKPIAGSKAAGFMAKLDQLEGKNFLQAYETLKGGGQITEVEGKKATASISAMQIATSEKQFKEAAEDLKSVFKKGLERARGKVTADSDKVESPKSELPKVGEIDGGYKFLGGDPSLQKNWRKQ